MGRSPKGDEALPRARRALTQAKTASELRAAQAVALPLLLRLSLAETARAVGRSIAWVSRNRRQFMDDKPARVPKARGGRRRELLPEADESALIMAACVRKAEVQLQWYRGPHVSISEVRKSVATRVKEELF